MTESLILVCDTPETLRYDCQIFSRGVYHYGCREMPRRSTWAKSMPVIGDFRTTLLACALLAVPSRLLITLNLTKKYYKLSFWPWNPHLAESERLSLMAPRTSLWVSAGPACLNNRNSFEFIRFSNLCTLPKIPKGIPSSLCHQS